MVVDTSELKLDREYVATLSEIGTPTIIDLIGDISCDYPRATEFENMATPKLQIAICLAQLLKLLCLANIIDLT